MKKVLIGVGIIILDIIALFMGFFAGTAEISGQVISQKAVLSVYTFFPYSQ
ncbi:hypothetical protein I5P78_23010 [Serratia marcescens]|nr:hypothetical protein [Serratia marcescens]